ncbi:hypothetical protein NF865_01775 [Thermococcus aggregans]|uniref:Uncharacterized protein n=1 Tax=Thermococcus aggregans TaxID=110163 RepID=A0A9E7SP18_THEAG|nr:hypothetical protein [Thermococcus aggregans]USS40974.1 hypothetical protein NF865_01775 [Thermococcus aggregans]
MIHKKMLSWHFDLERIRWELTKGVIPPEKSIPIQRLSPLFILRPSEYSLKIDGKEVLAEPLESLDFLNVPLSAFLVSIYLHGWIDEFNRRVVARKWFEDFLRKFMYPPELRRLPDPRLKETPIPELEYEYGLKCSEIKGTAFEAWFGKIDHPILFKLEGEGSQVCANIAVPTGDHAYEMVEVSLRCNARGLAAEFHKMGMITLGELEGLASLIREPLQDVMRAYLDFLKRIGEFSSKVAGECK